MLTRYTPDAEAERLQHLLSIGFSHEAAEKIFEAIDLPPAAVIDRRLADLRALGFADPVKMITSSPAILGYAPERVRLVGGIVARLDDRRDAMVAQLINKRRTAIEAVAAAGCRTWEDVRAVLRGSG